MKITIEESIRVKKEVEVEFPIYREQWFDSSTIYTKVESEEKEVSIHLYENKTKAELEIETPRFWGSKNYLLGEGEHKSSKEAFQKSVIELNKIISEIK